jgi:hypothetical protein
MLAAPGCGVCRVCILHPLQRSCHAPSMNHTWLESLSALTVDQSASLFDSVLPTVVPTLMAAPVGSYNPATTYCCCGCWVMQVVVQARQGGSCADIHYTALLQQALAGKRGTLQPLLLQSDGLLRRCGTQHHGQHCNAGRHSQCTVCCYAIVCVLVHHLLCVLDCTTHLHRSRDVAMHASEASRLEQCD